MSGVATVSAPGAFSFFASRYVEVLLRVERFSWITILRHGDENRNYFQFISESDGTVVFWPFRPARAAGRGSRNAPSSRVPCTTDMICGIRVFLCTLGGMHTWYM